MIKVFKNKVGKEKVIQSYNQLLEMWGTDYEEHDIDTLFGTTHCITSGNIQNPPLLLFHGVGDNSAVMWVLNMRELAQHFYCIAVDTIGGPGKSVPNDQFNKKTFNQLEWIHQIMDCFNLKTVNMAGVSNGAYMIYNYAAAHPERVNKVICMEGGMVIAPFKSMLQTLLIMFPEILFPTQHNLLKVLKKLSSPTTDVFHTFPFIAEHLVLLMKNHNQQAMFVHKLQKYERDKGITVKDKLYFLLGDHRIELQKELINVLKADQYTYKIIPNAGHGINHEQPQAVNSEMIRILSQ